MRAVVEPDAEDLARRAPRCQHRGLRVDGVAVVDTRGHRGGQLIELSGGQQCEQIGGCTGQDAVHPGETAVGQCYAGGRLTGHLDGTDTHETPWVSG